MATVRLTHGFAGPRRRRHAFFGVLLAALALGLPMLANAQAFKCIDPASGRTLYTDQPCPGGKTVVPALTPEQQRAEAERADAARSDLLDRKAQVLERERDRLDQQRALAEVQAPPLPSESADCRAARNEAEFRAGTVGATDEQNRTARANAALACGQPAPDEIGVWPQQSYQPAYVRPHRRHDRDRTRERHPWRSPSPNNPLGIAPYPLN